MGTLQLLRAVGHGIALGALIVGLAAAKLCAQVRYGYVVEPARTKLARAWDDSSAYQVERIYQVTDDTIVTGSEAPLDTLFMVKDVVECWTENPTPRSIRRFHCPDPSAPTIHTHAPTTCDSVQCQVGGINAFDANASRVDRATLIRRGARYGAVQVSRDVFAFYFPGQELLEPAPSAPAAAPLELELPIPSAAVLIGSLLSGYAVGWIDRDPGGYPDSFRGHDKLAHASTCAALYAAVRSLGAPPWLAAAAPMLAGVALEVGQSRDGGYGSPYDVVATGAGCGVALAVDAQLRRIRQP